MARVVVAVAMLVILASGSVVAFDTALKEGGERTAIAGESWTPNAGSVTTLNDSNEPNALYDENVTVRDSNGNEVEPGSDYQWFAANGTIKTVQGGALDGESSAEIDYGYDTTTQNQRDMATLLSEIPSVIALAIPAVLVLLLLGVFLR